MTLKSSKLDFIWKNQRAANLFSYLLVGGMMVCFAITIQQAVENYFDGWQGGFLPWVAIVFSIEALYTQNLMRRRGLSYLDREFWFYRVAEWVVLLITLRVLLYFISGSNVFEQDLYDFRSNFLAFFDDDEFVGVMVFMFVIWFSSSSFGADIDLLQARPTDVLFEHISEMEIDRQAAKRNILRRILTIGMALVFLTVVVRLNLGQFFGETGSTRIATLNLVVYFSLALILLSVSQYALLSGRWLWEGTPIHSDIVARWFLFASGFLVFLILLAMILPTRYTFGFLEILRLLVEIINYIFGVVFFFFILIFSSLYALILSLLGANAEPLEPQRPQLGQLSDLLGEERAPISGNPFLDILISVLFWFIFIAIILLAFGYYLRQNEELLIKLRKIRLVNWIIGLVEYLFGGLSQLGNRFVAFTSASLHTFRDKLSGIQEPQTPGFLSLRKLSPQDKIIFYYQALIRRGSEKGLARKKYQTPHQYMQELRISLPEDAGSDLEALTDHFVEARYSQHQIVEEQVTIVQIAWQHLRQTLRNLTTRVNR